MARTMLSESSYHLPRNDKIERAERMEAVDAPAGFPMLLRNCIAARFSFVSKPHRLFLKLI